MKIFFNLTLFFAAVAVVSISIVSFFLLENKVSNFSLPKFTGYTISDLVKFSRFSLEKAPSQSLVGNIKNLRGEVNFESRMATESSKLFNPINIQQGEKLETGKDGEIELSFDDAAELIIMPETSVSIIQTLPVNLVFAQQRGFVQYKKLSEVPVSLRIMHLLIEIDGQITVNKNKEISVIDITVDKGGAQIAYNDNENITKTLKLKEGQRFNFNDDTRQGVLI